MDSLVLYVCPFCDGVIVDVVLLAEAEPRQREYVEHAIADHLAGHVDEIVDHFEQR